MALVLESLLLTDDVPASSLQLGPPQAVVGIWGVN